MMNGIRQLCRTYECTLSRTLINHQSPPIIHSSSFPLALALALAFTCLQREKPPTSGFSLRIPVLELMGNPAHLELPLNHQGAYYSTLAPSVRDTVREPVAAVQS